VEFHGREFKCDPRALIPRPETEELAAALVKRIPASGGALLDMGTGSGVIGLTIALERPEWRVTLADVSAEALDLARENAARLGIGNGAVDFVQGDLFERIDGSFGVIAANLPYIPRAELASLAPEVSRDPRIALDGGDCGTEIIERFMGAAADRVEAGGLVAMEIGEGQAEGLAGSLAASGFAEIEVGTDCSGAQRFLFARKR
jgi:release factor glutamine methyltransferase